MSLINQTVVMYSLGFIAKWECLRAERFAGNLLFFVASSQISLFDFCSEKGWQGRTLARAE